MDFREHQDNAKKNSRIIWILYVLLLLVSSSLIGWTFVVGLNLAELYQPGYEQYSFWDKFSSSNAYIFNSKNGQLEILAGFSATAFIIQGLTTAVGFLKNPMVIKLHLPLMAS
jgi:hypothetical protein